MKLLPIFFFIPLVAACAPHLDPCPINQPPNLLLPSECENDTSENRLTIPTGPDIDVDPDDNDDSDNDGDDSSDDNDDDDADVDDGDHDKGHGNDDDGFDEDNPGKSHRD
jgi:hypothetical protein